MRMHRRISLSLALCSVIAVSGQHPQWHTAVGPVQRSGHHLILLSPEAVARSQPSLQDIRLIAPDSTLVPTLFRTGTAQVNTLSNVPFTVLRNERAGNKTLVEFEVPPGTLVDGLELLIRNAEVEKSARITGSDDGTHWYMVKDEGLALSGNGQTRALRWLDLPLSDHRYFRIAINDSLSAPVQVLSVGHTVQTRSEGVYVSAGKLRWDRTGTKGRTVFRLYGDHPLLVDRVLYVTTDTLPYMRRGTWYTNRREWVTERKRRKVLREWREDLGSVTFASYQRRVLQGPGVALDTLFLEVENGDDRPLAIASLEALQLQRSILAPLQAGVAYTFTTGDPLASAPRFDLSHFRDSLPAAVDTLRLSPLAAFDTAPSEPEPFDVSSIWLWVAIILVGGAAAFGAIRAMRKS